jgi:hypothetical protein
MREALQIGRAEFSELQRLGAYYIWRAGRWFLSLTRAIEWK